MSNHGSCSHLSEDELVLHYYGDMPAADEAAASAHLQACATCRQEYTVLQRVLGAVDDSALAPAELPASFDATVWARLEPNLPRQERGWLSWLLISPAPLGLAAAVLVLIGAAFFAGRVLSPPAPAPSGSTGSGDQIRERILLVDLGQHLERSQMLLVELVSSDDGTVGEIADGRTYVEQLVADNRLYRLTAEATGNRAVSELLDEIERVLTELAAGPTELSPQDVADMRDRIEARDLLFKLRVVASEIRERQKENIQARAVGRL